MNKIIKKIFLLLVLSLFSHSVSLADNSHFIDWTKVLNKTKAGAEAQEKLKKNFQSESSKFKKQEAGIKEEEKKLIAQKNVITKDEYLKKVQELRNKVANLQKARQNSLKKLSESRNLAKKNLLTKINPIVQKYMTDNNIRMILDKKGVLMGDKTLEITDKIITIINKEITSIKIN